MGFTYAASALASHTISAIRLELGDTKSSGSVFEDDELTYFYSQEGSSVLKAAAHALEQWARYASRNPVSIGSAGLNITLRPDEARKQATELRKRAAGTSSTVAMTRRDGYSDSVVAGS